MIFIKGLSAQQSNRDKGEWEDVYCKNERGTQDFARNFRKSE